ncbi:MAG TPA: GNAT family N-acetyltransferase [Mycobacteriales bacterium]|nr:GNAT family N-acetyltransferase [Mycobacteriales bacterium]
MSELELREVAYDSAVAAQLVAAVQAEYVARYGGPDETPVEPGEFAAPQGLFLVGYLDGVPVATGGFRRHAPTAVELKRMYVVPEARGKGLSRVMLAALEDRARLAGARRIVLETGDRQPEAVSLYESSGYERIPGFGHYACAPESYSFAKDL